MPYITIGEQQDAHEFYCHLIDHLSERVKGGACAYFISAQLLICEYCSQDKTGTFNSY